MRTNEHDTNRFTYLDFFFPMRIFCKNKAAQLNEQSTLPQKHRDTRSNHTTKPPSIIQSLLNLKMFQRTQHYFRVFVILKFKGFTVIPPKIISQAVTNIYISKPLVYLYPSESTVIPLQIKSTYTITVQCIINKISSKSKLQPPKVSS